MEVIIGEAVAGEAAKVKDSLTTAIKTYNSSVFDVMTFLYTIKTKKFYQPEFNTMAEFIETLNIKLRRAHYLIRIAEVMESVGLVREEFEPAGLSVLREISRLDPVGTYKNPVTGVETPMKEFILELTKDSPPLDKVKESVRVLLGQVGPESTTWLNLPFKRGVMEHTIRPALEKAKQAIGTPGMKDGKAVEPSDSSAWEMISADYLGGPE